MTSHDPAASSLLAILKPKRANYDGLWIHKNLTTQVNQYIIHEDNCHENKTFGCKKCKEYGRVSTRHRRAREIWEDIEGELEEMDWVIEELKMRIDGPDGQKRREKYGRFRWQGKSLEKLRREFDQSVFLVEQKLGPLESCTNELWQELEKEDRKCWTQTRQEWEAAMLAQRNEPEE